MLGDKSLAPFSFFVMAASTIMAVTRYGDGSLVQVKPPRLARSSSFYEKSVLAALEERTWYPPAMVEIPGIEESPPWPRESRLYFMREVKMEERELQTNTDSKPIPEKQGQGTDEGTGMGATWDIQRFRRLLDRARAKRLGTRIKDIGRGTSWVRPKPL
jgi:hypothetical protein